MTFLVDRATLRSTLSRPTAVGAMFGQSSDLSADRKHVSHHEILAALRAILVGDAR